MDEDKSPLAAGYLPSVEEVDAIRSRNMEREVLITGINEEIATLCARRRRLITASTIGKAIIAPIRKIPVEVLEEILFQSIPSFLPESFEPGTLHPQDVCRLLGNVCKEWRTIVNDTPRLFSSLTITWETLLPNHVYQLLKKSKSYPLDIFIKPSYSWSFSENVKRSKVFAMLHGELWRIRSLIAHTLLDPLFPPGFLLHAPLMQSFTHSRTEHSDHSHDLDLGGVYCPELRSVTLKYSDNIVRIMTATPMQTVRHLQVDCDGPNALYFQFLNSLPHLVSLYWGHSYSTKQPLEAPLAVTLQSLKALHVHTNESAMQLLSYLYAPSLESLEIDCHRGSPTPSMEGIIEVICRDGVVKLRHLHLIFGAFQTLMIPMMLRKLDHLDTLIINQTLMSDHLLTALAVPDQDFGTLCPKLTTLVIVDTEVPQDLFDKFVHSRMLADSEEPAPGFVTCLKLHGRELLDDHIFQRCSQTHSATIHITCYDDPDPSEEYFPRTMWEHGY